MCGLRVDGGTQQRRGARDDGLQLVGLVELKVSSEAEAVAQRCGQQARSRRGADDGERRQGQRDRGGAGALTHDDINAEVLHRQVQHFLGSARETVDLVDEEDVPLLETRQNRGEVAGVLDCRAGRQTQRRPHLRRDDHRERRLTQSGRAGEQNVVRAGRAHARGVKHELQLASHDALTDELRELLGAQGGLCRALELARVGGDDAHRIDVETGIHLISHVRLPASREQRGACRRRRARCPPASRWP